MTALPTETARLRTWLAIASTVQLGASVAGLVVSVRRRHPYDFLFLHGKADKVARDAFGMGTPLSAPAAMLAAQGAAIVQLARGRTGRPEQVLAGLGSAMVPGYLGETLVRRRLRPSGFDRVETPVAVTGLTMAAAMALLGWSTVRSAPRAQAVTPVGAPRRAVA